MSDSEVDAARAWLQQHDIRSVQVQALTLQGSIVGKRLAVDEFLAVLPEGIGLPATVLHQNVGGDYAFTFEPGPWAGELRDVWARPDLRTLVSLDPVARSAAVLADLYDDHHAPLPVCPRSLLQRLLGELGDAGLSLRVAFELEGTVFEEPFDVARARDYDGLTPLGSHQKRLCHGRPPASYVDYAEAVTQELDRIGVPWSGWVNEGGLGQLEVNFHPQDPLAAADDLVRARAAMISVAERCGRTATFMPLPTARTPAGLHVHLSLWEGDRNLFADREDGRHLDLWIAGLVSTMAAFTSLVMPGLNSFRRLVPGHGAPTAPLWARQNKTVALRVIPGDRSARLEHRLAGADANPYLMLAGIVAGGLIGARGRRPLPPEFAGSAWGLPEDFEPSLPSGLIEAADALCADEELGGLLGELVVRYWAGTRRWEWYACHTQGADPNAVTAWERRRYFESV
ncbi:glutamine synthetase [Nocardioides thalensis]|uniref:Glutamine synthetase n=1 Tax=Nocardioides thalensis TaxID=1914755 RepID=A0A853C679_9ACTN|nr:glutamine synthetase family protein [Nocardioides thalensis]NYJ03345.1 glutamine synthetase [Nocardioides thalensis]